MEQKDGEEEKGRKRREGKKQGGRRAFSKIHQRAQNQNRGRHDEQRETVILLRRHIQHLFPLDHQRRSPPTTVPPFHLPLRHSRRSSRIKGVRHVFVRGHFSPPPKNHPGAWERVDHDGVDDQARAMAAGQNSRVLQWLPRRRSSQGEDATTDEKRIRVLGMQKSSCGLFRSDLGQDEGATGSLCMATRAVCEMGDSAGRRSRLRCEPRVWVRGAGGCGMRDAGAIPDARFPAAGTRPWTTTSRAGWLLGSGLARQPTLPWRGSGRSLPRANSRTLFASRLRSAPGSRLRA